MTELEFGVGLYFPTSGENRKQFEPLFNELARAVNLPAKVTVADDWVGISEALRSGIPLLSLSEIRSNKKAKLSIRKKRLKLIHGMN